MAKVDLKIEVQLTAAVMRKLNPVLRRKGLMIQEAVEEGLKKRIPTMYLDLTAYLAAVEGLGVDLSKPQTKKEILGERK